MTTSIAYSRSWGSCRTDRVAVPLVLAVFLAGCRPSPRPPAPRASYDPATLQGARAMKEVTQFLSVGPRPSGSSGAQRAAGYLAARLEQYGLSVSVDEFREASGNTNVLFRNVLGTVTGQSDRTIILASHYDTKAGISPGFIGANDSGSSTGLLLELARLLAGIPAHSHTIVCAFLDGEECAVRYGPHDGLHGSRRLAGQISGPSSRREIVAVIVLDMVGDRNLSVTIPRNSSPELVSMAFQAARDHGVRSMFSLAATDILDDHVPFRKAGIPAIDIIDFQFGSVPGKNDYWHTDQDTIDKISEESLEIVGRVTLGMLNRLANRSPGSIRQ